MGLKGQMRRGMARLISLDGDTGKITRAITVDNGRGGLVPSGEPAEHNVYCRISYEGGGVWHRGEWAGGLATGATPYVLASPETDIKANDVLEWRGKRYTVGPVTFPPPGRTVLQAPLTEVKPWP
jgi:hypothetical protein